MSMEVWMFGGLEVWRSPGGWSPACRPGGDVAERCKDCERGNRRLRRLEPIRGVLPHAKEKVVLPKRRSHRPIGPIRPICPTASPFGTSEQKRLGSLVNAPSVARLRALLHLLNLLHLLLGRPSGTSAGRAAGAGAACTCRGQGAAPLQSANQPISQNPLCVLCGSLCPL